MFVILDIMSAKTYIRVMTELRNHVKQHRARVGLTQEELGARVGVRRQTILAIEKGHYVPSTLVAFKIARQLGMSVDDLFELVDTTEVKT
jgi:putative transcriptional regulator